MGNTHSEAPIQRERDLPLQAVEVLRKDREKEKPSQKPNPSGKEEQQRQLPPTACAHPTAGTEPQQAREVGANPQLSVGGHPANAAILDARAKPSQGKKRKIAKARKWTSGQAASQEAVVVVDKLTGERLHSASRTEQDRAHSPNASEGLATAVAALGFCHHEKEEASENQARQGPAANAGNKDDANQDASIGCTASKCTEQATDAGTTSKQSGQGEPGEGALHPLSPASQRADAAKAGKRAQLACSLQGPQGKSEPDKGQNAAVNGKESPCKLIKLSIIRSPPSPQAAGDEEKPPAFLGNGQSEQGKGAPRPEKAPDAARAEQAGASGKPGERAAEAPVAAAERGGGRGPKPGGQPAPARQADAGSLLGEVTPAGFKQAPGQDVDPAPPVGVGPLKAHSFLNKRGTQGEPGLSPADKTEPLVDLPPLPPGAKATAAHRAKHGGPAGISYAEALKQVPLLRHGQDVKCPAKETKAEAEAAGPDLNGAKELGDMAQVQDGASAAFKKKLPFYEQLIASLKSQTQRQKGAKPQRQILAQEEPSHPKPAKSDCPLEAPILLQVPPEPLLPPDAEAQTVPRSPQPPSQPSFQFEAQSQLPPPEQSVRTKADPKFRQWFQLQQPIFQFQSKLGQRTNPQEQAEATSNVSFGPLCQAAIYPQHPVPMSGTVPQLSTSVQLQSQSWLRQQIEAQCRLQLHPPTQPVSVSMGSPPPLYTQPQLNAQPVLGNPAMDQLPIWPLLQSQTQAQAKFSAITHLQCQQRPKAAIPTPLHLQISCNLQQQAAVGPQPQPQLPALLKSELPQQQKQIQAQAQAASKAQHQPEPKGNSKLSAPTPVQPKPATKPQKQDQFPPKALLPTSSKAKSQAQAKGRKAQASLLNQQPPPRQEPVKVQAETEPAAEGKSPVRRPTGRWSAFQIDKTCTRKCHCRHREDQGTSHLPRNIATWGPDVADPSILYNKDQLNEGAVLRDALGEDSSAGGVTGSRNQVLHGSLQGKQYSQLNKMI